MARRTVRNLGVPLLRNILEYKRLFKSSLILKHLAKVLVLEPSVARLIMCFYGAREDVLP